MKKILILGAGGFIGSYIAPRLTKNNIVMSITKPGIDVTDAAAVRNILELSQPDFVINCLTFGGNENVNSNDPSIVAKNLAMYYNFKSNSNLFGRYINIGSGVEKDYSNNSAYAFSKIFSSGGSDFFQVKVAIVPLEVPTIISFKLSHSLWLLILPYFDFAPALCFGISGESGLLSSGLVFLIILFFCILLFN